VTARRGAVLGLAAAVVAGVGSVLSWLAATSTVPVPPVLEGEPWTTSVVYNAPWLVFAMMLATIAGVLVVIGIALLRRGSHQR
jgi:hypothetical protein